jgi:hypothetical protein
MIKDYRFKERVLLVIGALLSFVFPQVVHLEGSWSSLEDFLQGIGLGLMIAILIVHGRKKHLK